MRFSPFYALVGIVFLSGCETYQPNTTFEPKPEPGLFTGEKGYFEIMPGGPESEEAFKKSPGIFGEKADEDPNAPERSDLEKLSAS